MANARSALMDSKSGKLSFSDSHGIPYNIANIGITYRKYDVKGRHQLQSLSVAKLGFPLDFYQQAGKVSSGTDCA